MAELKDVYNRRIDYARISITDRCNLRCAYCADWKSFTLKDMAKILRFEEIEKIILILLKLGISHIRLTGGEPLLRRGVVDLVRRISRFDGLKDFSMTTNGVYLRECAMPLKDAGLKRVNISLDTLDRKKFMEISTADLLGDVRRGIDAAIDAGLEPVKVNTVIIKGFNDDEIEDFTRLAIEKPIHWRFIEFMPMGRNSYWSPERFMPISAIKAKVFSLGKPLQVNIQGCGPSTDYRIGSSEGSVGFISPIEKGFCEACNRIRITADGFLRGCLHSDAHTDIKSLLREGVPEEKIEEVIRTSIYKKPKSHDIRARQGSVTNEPMAGIGG
ncbi:MAG: cyclic pyranopterin phosphate synthase MoaA [Candidatus Omnitrophica bacterium CG1_02_49_10]|nr:MAG: cyclic pyranopterin phosphate synthase MoaA [Candidatus Omnitrophica bacterium CG1_02_49_10]